MEELGQVSAPEAKFPPALLLARALQAALRGTEGRVEEGGNPAAYKLLQFLGAPGAAEGLEKIGFEGMQGAVGPNGVLWDTRANVPHMNSRSVDTAGAISPFVGGLMRGAERLAGSQAPGKLNAILVPVDSIESHVPLGKQRVNFGGQTYAPVRTEGKTTRLATHGAPQSAAELYPELKGSRLEKVTIKPFPYGENGLAGYYSAPNAEIGYATNSLGRPAFPHEIHPTLDHELTHAAQQLYEQPFLGASPDKVSNLLRVEEYNDLVRFAQDNKWHPEVLQRILETTQKSRALDYHQLYRSDPGEILATFAEKLPHSYDLSQVGTPKADSFYLSNFLKGNYPELQRGHAPSVAASIGFAPANVQIPIDLFQKGLVMRDAFINDTYSSKIASPFRIRDENGNWIRLKGR